jgi:excisionase family DNA binding protein
MEKFYKLSELAKIINYSESKVRIMIKKKEIPVYRIGSEYRFSVEEIGKWLKAKKVA